MIEKKKQRKINGVPGVKAQAIVEFAIVLPILLMVIIGILEVGRYILIYSSATNASRNAVRYASVIGYDDNGLTKYNYCDGIRNIARKSIFLVNPSTVTVQINYFDKAGTAKGQCDLWNTSPAAVKSSIVVNTEDRVKVVVTVPYKPMVSLIPIKQRTITSASTRTYLGIIPLAYP